MSVSGLVLTLTADRDLRRAALEALRSDRRIEVGQVCLHRVPIVVDTPCGDDDRAVFEALHEIPGVMFVDVVCVHELESPNGADS